MDLPLLLELLLEETPLLPLVVFEPLGLLEPLVA